MTNISVFGEQNEQKKREAIELVWFLNKGGRMKAIASPDSWDHICLLGADAKTDFDLIMAWDDDDDYKYIYLGHWNDGIV